MLIMVCTSSKVFLTQCLSLVCFDGHRGIYNEMMEENPVLQYTVVSYDGLFFFFSLSVMFVFVNRSSLVLWKFESN